MFERNVIDQGTCTEKKAHPVHITLDDGSKLRGRMMVSKTRSINQELNMDGRFVVFEPYRGDQMLLAKTAIRSLSVTNVPKASQLQGRRLSGQDFDPHAVLGIAHGAAHEIVRSAYHNLAKAYHPDRYASQDLPDEIMEYAGSMLRRINLAYAELSEQQLHDARHQDAKQPARANFGTGTPAG